MQGFQWEWSGSEFVGVCSTVMPHASIYVTYILYALNPSLKEISFVPSILQC